MEPRRDDEDEAELVRRAQRGDGAAFARLVRLHQGTVRVYLGAHVHRRDVIEDLAQDVFLTAFRRLGTYRGEVPLARWLLGVARNRALEFLRAELRRQARKERSLPELLAEWRIALVDAEEGGSEARLQEIAALRTCLENLPAPSAALVTQHYVESRSLVEIAEAQGRNESTVRVALLRIRHALRDCVRRRLAEAIG